MLHYDPTISIITGIAWDHVNIYKTYDDYKDIFYEYVKNMNKDSVCYFDQSDEDLFDMMSKKVFDTKRHGYLPYPTDKKGRLVFNNELFSIQVFGRHNLLNLKAAQLVCSDLGIKERDFLTAMSNFSGAAKRLELILDTERVKIYKDFAHAPSKCKATVEAVRSKYPNSKIRAVMELHTFSSLTPEFITHYNGAMDGINHAAVFYDPKAISMKQMKPLDKENVRQAFGTDGLIVLDSKEALTDFMESSSRDGDDVVLIMSSGNLAGFDLNLFAESLK
jgi:UDP-N-acetylmuramate: L-alanyl-gamma-D-glutamyl-meso-diaminopimelate ligase